MLQGEIIKKIGLNKNTVVEWFKDLRELCMLKLMIEDNQLGGVGENGQPKVVKINESVFLRENTMGEE